MERLRDAQETYRRLGWTVSGLRPGAWGFTAERGERRLLIAVRAGLLVTAAATSTAATAHCSFFLRTFRCGWDSKCESPSVRGLWRRWRNRGSGLAWILILRSRDGRSGRGDSTSASLYAPMLRAAFCEKALTAISVWFPYKLLRRNRFPAQALVFIGAPDRIRTGVLALREMSPAASPLCHCLFSCPLRCQQQHARRHAPLTQHSESF